MSHFLQKLKKYEVVILLTLIVLLIGGKYAFDLYFIFVDKTPPFWDEAVHLSYAYEYVELIRAFNWQKVFTAYMYYPPLLYLLFAASSLLSVTRHAVVFFNYFFVLFLLASQTLLFVQRRRIRIVPYLYMAFVTSAFVLYICPAVTFMLDLPLTSLTVSTIIFTWFLLVRKKFSVSWILLLAVFTSATTLSKWTGVFYLFVPLTFFWISGIRHTSWKKYLSLLFIFGVASALLNIWYFFNFAHLKSDLLFNGITIGRDIEHDPNFWKGLYTYSKFSIEKLAPLIVISIGMAIVSRKKLQQAWRRGIPKLQLRTLYFPCTLTCSLLIFSLIPNKDSRYILPLVVLAQVWIAHLFFQFFSLRFFRIAMLLCAGIFVVQIFRHQAPINSHVFIWNVVENYSRKHNSGMTAYFFEDDLETFNYASVYLLHRRLDLHYYRINTNDPAASDAEMRSCNLRVDPDVVIIISNDTHPFQRFVSYEEVCKDNEFMKKCVGVEDRTFENHDRVRILTCGGKNGK